MEKPLCRLCGQRHYGNCQGVTPSHGNPRVETRPLGEDDWHKKIGAPPKAPRRPLVPVTKPVTNVTNTVTQCPRCVTLERDVTNLRNKIAELETELKTTLATPRGSKPPPLTPAERQRRARARKAAKAHVATTKHPPP